MIELCVAYMTLFVAAAYRIYNNNVLTWHEFDIRATKFFKAIIPPIIALVHLNLCCFIQDGFRYPIIQDFSGAWGQWGVVLFFMISGYGLTSSIEIDRIYYLQKLVKIKLFNIIVPLMLAIILCNIKAL